MDKTIHNFRISIREEKRSSPLGREILEKLTDRTFRITGRKEGDISLVFCDDDFIKNLNERYLHRHGPTDVLSFSMREGESSSPIDTVLGDIIISVDTAKRQAEKMQHSLQKEVMILFVHGLLHLLGYTHDSNDTHREMTDNAQEIMKGVDSVP